MTSVIYVANPNNGVAIPAFKERNLSNLMPSSVSDVAITAIRIGEYNHSYGIASASLQEVIECTLKNTLSHRSYEFRDVLRLVPGLTPFDRPILVVKYAPASPERWEQIKNCGMTEGKDNTFYGSPSNAEYTQLMKYEPIPSPFVPGKVDTDAYAAYIFGLKALRAFSYMSDVCDRQYNANVKFHDPKSVVDREEGDVAIFSPGGKYGDVKMGDDKTTYVTGRMRDFLVPLNYKKEIPDTTITNLSAGDNVPLNTKATVFPYFEGMVNSDKDTAINVFQKYFIKSLGGDIKESALLWEILRKGFRKLAFCAAGRAMSHAFLGIQMAESAQCGIVYIVTQNRYRGFMLYGNFNIILRGNIKEPGPDKDAEEFLKSMGSDVQKKVELQALIRLPVNMDGNVINDITQEDLKDSRSFFKYMQKAKLSAYSKDQKAAIIQKVDSIEWEMKYAEIKEENVLRALEYIDTGNDDHIAKYSAFLQNGFFWTDSPLNYAFGIFGSFAPSVMYEGKETKILVIPSEDKHDDLRTKDANGKYPLPYLPVYKTGAENAVAKWTQLFNTGKLAVNPPTKGKKGAKIEGAFSNPKREFGKIQGQVFEEGVYPVLRKLVSAKRDAKAKGKRSRVDGGDEDMDVDKVKKMKVASSSRAFDMIVE